MIHRGWIVLILTVLNLLACLGFGRFSLGAILPFMREGLHLSYSEMGFIASAVFFGYLVSAVLVGHLINQFSAKAVVIVSLAIVGAGMIFSSIVDRFWTAYLACLLIGMGSGGGNVTSLSLVGRWFSLQMRGTALGIANSGSGIGMIVSGILVHLFMVGAPNHGWRLSWMVLAGSVVGILLLNIFFLTESPEKYGLKPIGSDQEGRHEQRTTSFFVERVYTSKVVWLLGGIYFTWGFSYMFFSTFFVDYLINDVELDKQTAGYYFASAGTASIFSGFIWGSLSGRMGRMPTLFLIYFIQATLLLTFSVTSQPIFLYVETILYALTLWAVPTVLVAAISDVVDGKQTAIAIGFITLFLGVGQWISPMVSGYLLHISSSYTMAIFLSAAVCYLGSCGCLYLYWKSIHLREKEVKE
jgi:MFS family permease